MRIKICGLTRAADARAADRLGASYLGTVLTDGFSRSVTPEAAAALLEGTVATRVAVLVDEPAARAAAMAHAIGAGVVQLHGHESAELTAEVRSLGDWRVWKAVRAATLDELAEAVDRYGEVVDALLVEGFRPGVIGGGGARLALDPREVRATIPSDLEFVLAGGLTPGSVHDAVALFLPDVVDVSSGVEAAPGEKDETRIATFIQEASRSSERFERARTGDGGAT